MKLLISTPSNRDWKLDFGLSVVALVTEFTARKINFTFKCHRGSSLIPVARQNILDDAIINKFDYILMIDDDMVFKPSCVLKMLERQKDVVVGNYVKKGSGESVTEDLDGNRIYSKDKTGIEKVFHSGLGFCLIRVDAIKTIGGPHFNVWWHSELQQYIGEDVNFFWILKERGIDVWVDHDASQDIGHCGDMVYRE